MSELVFLQDLAIVMVVGAVTMVICHRLHLPVVLGYILAGLLIGPYTPPYSLVTDTHSIHTLSALGVIFLLFSIGLEFSMTKLLKVGPVAFFASTFEILLMIWIGFSLGKMMGWGQMDSLFLGAILSISSTTIIAKILMENKKFNESFAQIILGILVVEDLWAMVIIAVLSGIATTGAFTMGEISVSMFKVFIFIVGILFFGFLLVPRILRYIERFQIPEVMTIVVLGLCFGVSLLAAKAGFSIALGAFLIGAVISETKQGHGIVLKMEPIRDMFTAIFFVSIGMLIDPAVIAKYAIPILIFTVVTIVGKVFTCSLATFLTGHDSQTSMKVGLGLAQIGEFSFIIAQLGRDTEVTSSFLYPIAVSVSALTTITTPFLMNNSNVIISWAKRITPKPIVIFSHFYPAWFAKINESQVSNLKKIGLVLSSGSFFWRSILRIHEHIEKTVRSVMDYEKADSAQQRQLTHDQLVDLIRTNYPLSFETQDLLLGYEECGVNKTIKELDLRFKTGASIVGIYREDTAIPNPSATERLLPGDVLVLIGNPEQIKAGMQYLQLKMREPI